MTTTSIEQEQKGNKPKWWQTLLKGSYLDKRPRRGDILFSKILSIGDHDIFVELDGKRDGKVQRRDLDEVDEAYREHLSVGDRIPVRVLRIPYNRSAVPVSLKQGLEQKDWLRAQEMAEHHDVAEVEVTQVNRGGVVTRFGRLRGFVPNSHLASIPRGLKEERRREQKQALIGQTLNVVVIEVKPQRHRLILSERQAQRKRRKALLEELYEGAIRKGIVRNITDYGAFIDLGGVDGLLHITEMSWDYVKHPSDLLDIGDELEVYILDVDRERERISLSRKRLLPSPWEAVTNALERGDTLQGTVTTVASFGAFVDIGQGVEGLIPASTLPDSTEPQDSLAPESSVSVRVLDLDREQERITLELVHIQKGHEHMDALPVDTAE